MNTLSKGRVPFADDINRCEVVAAYMAFGRRLDDVKAFGGAGASRPPATGTEGRSMPRVSWGASPLMHLPGSRRIGGLRQVEGLYSNLSFGGNRMSGRGKAEMGEITRYRTGTASNLLKECVQAKINEICSMVGGRHPGKSAAATENGSQNSGDVPVQDAAKAALLGLSKGLCGMLRAIGGMVTRQPVGIACQALQDGGAQGSPSQGH